MRICTGMADCKARAHIRGCQKAEPREALRVIREPDLPDWQANPHPKTPAATYREGTVVEDARGIRWEVYFDTQDHALEWRRAKHMTRHQSLNSRHEGAPE